MKILKRSIMSFLAVLLIFTANVTGANAEWRAEGTKWWYSQGTSYLTGWNFIDGQWYHFDSKGYMDTGWFMDSNGSWYYLYDNGMMAHDCYIGNYYLNSNGKWTVSTNSSASTSSNKSTSVGTVNNKSQTAYLSATGDKYHSIPKCGRMNPNKATKTTVGQAEARGYGRCSKCW